MGRWGTQHCSNQEQQAGRPEMLSLPLFHTVRPWQLSSLCLEGPLGYSSETSKSMAHVPVLPNSPACTMSSCRGSLAHRPVLSGATGTPSGQVVPLLRQGQLHHTRRKKGQDKTPKLIRDISEFAWGVVLPVSKFEVPSTLPQNQSGPLSVTDIHSPRH